MASKQTVMATWLLFGLFCLLWGRTESAVEVTSYNCGRSWSVSLDRQDLPYTVSCAKGNIDGFEHTAWAEGCVGKTEFVRANNRRCREGVATCVLPVGGSDSPFEQDTRCPGEVPTRFTMAYTCDGVDATAC